MCISDTSEVGRGSKADGDSGRLYLDTGCSSNQLDLGSRREEANDHGQPFYLRGYLCPQVATSLFKNLLLLRHTLPICDKRYTL